MDAQSSQVFFPSNFHQLFSLWNRFPDAAPCAGGTGFFIEQGKRVPEFPQNIISLDTIQELHRISRTERYLEIGAMVNLNQIINLGRTVPEALTRCLKRIAGPHVRNMATIGGNICFPSRKLDAAAPMIALDAQYELRSAQSSRWVPAAYFSPPSPASPAREILTRIRVPLAPWSFTWYRKFLSAGSTGGEGSILFIMKNEKNILTNIRVLYSGKTILREKKSETMFLGKRLPLARKDVEAYLDSWRIYLSSIEGDEENSKAELIKPRVISFIKTMLQHISD